MVFTVVREWKKEVLKLDNSFIRLTKVITSNTVNRSVSRDPTQRRNGRHGIGPITIV